MVKAYSTSGRENSEFKFYKTCDRKKKKGATLDETGASRGNKKKREASLYAAPRKKDLKE